MSALSSPAPVRPPEKPEPVPVHAPPRKPRQWPILVGLLAALVGGGFLVYRALQKPVQPAGSAVVAIRTAKAVVAPLAVTLRVSGPTAARNFANITAPLLRGPESRGSLVLLEVAPPGSFVKKGQVVARIDAQSAQDHIDDVRDLVAAAESDVSKREAEQKVEWEDMQQTLRVAKSEFEKAGLDFSAAEVRTDVERELLKLSLEESEARNKQQQRDVAFRKTAQEAELKILGITLERQRRHLQRHLTDLERFTMRTPMDGLIVMATVFRGGQMQQVQQGDQVFPGQQVLKVVDTSDMQVEGSVSQADSGDLRVSQYATIGFDAFKDVRLKGRVHSIGALAVSGGRQNYYVRNVPVRIAIEGSDPRLIPDLSAHCDVVLETIPDQLQIPLAAVITENGKTWVELKRADKFERREVKLGKRSNLNVAVLSGLQAGDEVRVNPQS